LHRDTRKSNRNLPDFSYFPKSFLTSDSFFDLFGNLRKECRIRSRVRVLGKEKVLDSALAIPTTLKHKVSPLIEEAVY